MAAPRRRVRQRPDEEEDVVVKDSQEHDSQTTPQKKRRVGESDDADGHVEGAIVRVHLQNFITYDDCSFEPGPRLNVVIGPNGSGKSSIVCALALGLAGSTSLLGRAKDVSEYIKYGADKASITIELKGAQNSRNVVVRRDIKKDNSSEWRLNGKVVTKNDVLAKTKSMNVQVDNLCQFLPQDKVGSFAAMDPAQLLIETEKAVGTDKMHEYHEELINLRKTEKELDRTCEEHGNIATDLKKKNESLERDVLRFQERQKLVQKVEILEKKKPWLLFEDQRRIALELKDQRAEVNANYTAALQQKEPLEKKKKEIETKSKSIESTRISANNNLRKHSQEKDNRKKELEELERQADGLEVDFENLKNRAKNREKEAQAMKREITSSREEMKTLPTALEVKAIIDEKNGELKELNRGLGQIQAKKMTTQDSFKTSQSELNKFQAKVKEADDARHQALENMRRLNPDVYTAYVWVQQNQSKFKDKVYGPVCLEINVPDPLYAKYLEMTIPGWLITCFVCQNAEDRDLLLSELADRQKLPVNATFLPGAVNRERRADLTPLKRCGIVGFLEDVFTTSAPVVKEVLIANASVDIVAVGNNESVHHVEELLQSDLGLFYTPESRYAKTRSKYENRSISTSVVALKNAKYLSGVNMEQVREARRKMEEKRMELEVIREALTTCDQEEQQINVTINNIRKERDNANNDKKKADTIQKKIELKEKQLASLLKEEDTAQEEETLRNKLRGINANRARQAVALMKAIKSLVEAQFSVDETSLTRLDVQGALTKITDEIKAMDATHANLKRELEEISKRFDRAREYARKLKDEAERKAPLDGELTATLAELPNTIDELDAMITEHNRKIELLYATNPAVVQQYEARKREIEDISEKLESEQAQLAELKKKIADVKGKWLPPLEELMSKINVTFSKFFSEIGCVGEVALEKHEDYDKYGVQIKVKFRFEDSLQALNSHLQSGGERSVSTMLYLISLQDLTPCPFRVVDEINQGMDPYNERMIFRQVVQSAGRPGLPQYFLITPKLLPDLDYTPNMTVLCVYNGPWQFTQDEWDKRVKRIFS